MIPSNGKWTTLTNETHNKDNNVNLRGNDDSPSRQVSLILHSIVPFNKHRPCESPLETAHALYKLSEGKAKWRQGRRARNKQKHAKINTQPHSWWDSVWTVQDNAANTEIGDPQPEVEVGGDTSLFTRATDPLNPRCVAEILKHVSIGSDLSEEQQNKVRNLIAEFADCFALSVREVLPIPGAEHHINIPAGMTFPKKIPHQQPLTEAQCAYLSAATNELLAADIIEPIRPENVKCVSPLTLSQKTHNKTGLSTRATAQT